MKQPFIVLTGLSGTIADSGAAEIWVTHGREEALVHQATRDGRRAAPGWCGMSWCAAASTRGACARSA